VACVLFNLVSSAMTRKLASLMSRVSLVVCLTEPLIVLHWDNLVSSVRVVYIQFNCVFKRAINCTALGYCCSCEVMLLAVIVKEPLI